MGGHSRAPLPPHVSALCSKLNVPLDKLLLFWQGKELTHVHDSRTLLDLNLHTGFSLQVGVPGCLAAWMAGWLMGWCLKTMLQL